MTLSDFLMSFRVSRRSIGGFAALSLAVSFSCSSHAFAETHARRAVEIGISSYESVMPPLIELASLDHSWGDNRSIENFIRREYLTPVKGRIEQKVRRLYGRNATIFGVPLTRDAIVRAKTDWFSQWSSWALAYEPGSLHVATAGKDRVDVVFTMIYEYNPKSHCACGRSIGRARVCLSLARSHNRWLIISETSKAV